MNGWTLIAVTAGLTFAICAYLVASIRLDERASRSPLTDIPDVDVCRSMGCDAHANVLLVHDDGGRMWVCDRCADEIPALSPLWRHEQCVCHETDEVIAEAEAITRESAR